MKKSLNTLAIAGIAVLGCVMSSTAQVQQSISFTLTVYDQSDTGVRTLRVSNKDVIENLAGTTVPGGKLWLVMPTDPSPDGNGNIGAFLRVTDGQGNIIVETTTDTFNIYQTAFSQNSNLTYAWNQFSLDFGGLGAELYGTATWSKGSRSPGGQGTFHCSVSGHLALGGVTQGSEPCSGSISGGPPKPSS